MTREVESRVRGFLSHWAPWMIVAYFGLAIALFLYGRQQSEVARVVADRAAEQRSSVVSQVATCASAVKNAPDIAGVLDAIRFNVSDRLEVTAAANAAALPGDPLTPIRTKSLAKLQLRLSRLDSFIAKVNARTPTRESCNKLAAKVGVTIPFPSD